jgi:iron complex transport system substrate-binding protein
MMKKWRTKILGVMLMAAIMLLTGAGYAEKQTPPAMRTVTDMTGKTVVIPAKVNRVGTGGAINQMVLMLGGAKKIVATSTIVQANPMFVKIYPKIKKVSAPFVITEVNLEELLKTGPEVVFGGNAAMKSLGIPVIEVSLRDPKEIKQAVSLVGKVLGPKEAKNAIEFCSYYDANMKRVTDKTKALPADKRIRVYYNGGKKPTTTDGKNSISTAWIEMAGGVNVAAEAGLDGLGKDVSMEDLLKWNPEVIIVTDSTVKDGMLKNEPWKKISAVKNNRVFVNPKGVYLWSVRSAEEALQVLWAAKIVQPALFADIKMNIEVSNFYKTFYNYDLTKDELKEIRGDSWK